VTCAWCLADSTLCTACADKLVAEQAADSVRFSPELVVLA
jgi:hypothetical protein